MNVVKKLACGVVCDGDTATGYCDGTNQFHSITVADGIDATLSNFGVGTRNYSPRLEVETLVNGEWRPERQLRCHSYTVDKTAIGDGRIRLTWTWDIAPGFLSLDRALRCTRMPEGLW